MSAHILHRRPQLATAELPFEMGGATLELLWPRSLDGDERCRFLREQLHEVTGEIERARPRKRARR